MRRLHIITFFAALLLICGCADDKGSYDYAPENKITIGGLKEIYTITAHETFQPALAPELSFALNDNSNLTYSWMIDYVEVCDHPTLDVPIDATVGQHSAQLVITDNETSLKYYYDFTLHVETPYSTGLAVLSEMEDGTAKISFQQRETTGTIHDFQTDVFESNNESWGSLGKKPVAMTIQDDAGTEDYKKNTYYLVLCGDGERYVSVLDISTMQLQRAFLAGDISGCPSPWQPQMLSTGTSESLILANGKCFTYDAISCGRVSTPLDNSEHSLSWVDVGGYFKSSIVPGFDEATGQFVYLGQQAGRDFTFDDIHSFDEMYEDEDAYYYGRDYAGTAFTPVDLSGLQLVAGEKMYNDGGLHYSYSMGWFFSQSVNDDSDAAASTLRFIFKDPSDGTAHFYTYDFEVGQFIDENDYSSFIAALSSYGVTEDRVVSGLTLNNNTVVKALPYSKYWLIANGRDVVREFYLDGAASMQFSLPAEVKGDIVKMLPSKDESKLYVAVYDSSSSETNKGGIAIVSLDSKGGTFGKLLEYYPNVCGKAVSLIERTSTAATEE